MGHADHNDLAAWSQIVGGLVVYRDSADGHENRICAAPNGRARCVPRCVIAGQNPVCCTKVARDLKLFFGHIDGHDPACARDPRPLDGV